jgi:hypothetical protein
MLLWSTRGCRYGCGRCREDPLGPAGWDVEMYVVLYLNLSKLYIYEGDTIVQNLKTPKMFEFSVPQYP